MVKLRDDYQRLHAKAVDMKRQNLRRLIVSKGGVPLIALPYTPLAKSHGPTTTKQGTRWDTDIDLKRRGAINSLAFVGVGVTHCW